MLPSDPAAWNLADRVKGNMAINDPAHPEHSRAAQDVDELPQRTSMSEFHGGRGVSSILPPAPLPN